MAQEYRIISADSHVNPRPTFWRDYLPGKLAELAPQVEETDGQDFILFEGNRTPYIMLSSLAGKKAEDFKFTGKMSDARPGGWDPHERTKDQDIDGVDAEVLYGGGPLRTENRELAVASYRAYNEWLADFCKGAPERLFGIAYLPMWDLEEALDEVHHAAKIGLRGVLIPAAPPEGEFADPKYEVFWNTLEELNMPANLHVGFSGGRTPRFDNSTHFLSDMLMSKLGMAEPVANMIFSGILARHPKLKVVEVEGGVGWCAFAIQYMDHVWEKHRYWTKSDLSEPPSFYFHRQIRGTFVDDPVAVNERHTIGVESIMWSSDYPHSETPWPNSRQSIAKHFAGVPEDETFKMICGNAMELYGLS